MILKKIYHVLFNTLEKSFIPVPSPRAIVTFQRKPQKDITSGRNLLPLVLPQSFSLSCDKRHRVLPYNLREASHTWVVSWRNTALTAQILLLFIWLLFSTIRSFSPSICTGSLIIALFALYIIITTAYLELSPWTTQAAEDTENNQADVHCWVTGTLSPAQLSL